jgi:phosphohistidine phosphatase
MKTLLLLRHAKSSWGEPGLSDHERPLNERGKQDAPRIGQLLKQLGLTPDHIVCSSAKRARKTAKAVAQSSGYEGEVEQTNALYLAAAAQYVELLRQLPEERSTVLVVGHNPGLEDVLTALTGARERLTTAALAQVTFPIEHWRDLPSAPSGQLVNLWRPKELPESGEHAESTP